MIYFRCPKCRAQLSVSESTAGETTKCTECGNVTFIPSPALSPNAAASTAHLEHDQEQMSTEVEAGEPTVL
ncbi:MAG: hypothetical protein QF792_04290 [Phycisphaerae bacterium]|nr:hypothetical protein [Phycisphaerae bacterium]